MKVNIRSLLDHEIKAVLELWKAADSHPGITDNIEDISRLLARDHAAFLVADIDDRIVGSIIATFDGWRGIIYRLAVHPDLRRQGIARQLTRKAEEAFVRWGVRRVIAIVDPTRPYAVDFWKAAGYESDGMIRFYRNL
jgi:ribosomal protein S18 acetylase RimI-like enzyme